MHLLDESLEYIVYNLLEKLMEIYFFSIALPNTGRYFIRYSYFISRATICAKISKILKISNFSQLHLISKLIPQSSLIYFPPTVSHKSSRYISRATSPVLSFFFFFFFYIQIYDSYSPTRFTISTHLFPHIFVTNACDFPELIDNIYANSFVTKIP